MIRGRCQGDGECIFPREAGPGGKGVAHRSWGEGLCAAQEDARRRGEPGAAGAQPGAAPRRPSPRPPAHGLLPDTQNRGTRVQYLGNRRGFDLFPSHSKKKQSLERSYNNELLQQTHSSLPLPLLSHNKIISFNLP